MKTKANDPVDWSQYIKSQTSVDGNVSEGSYPGLTKRELFAAMILQGRAAKYGIELGAENKAIKAADALIEALNKEGNK